MPTTRKSVAARGVPAKGQSTLLSFSNKVTKSVPKDIKKTIISPPVAKVEVVQPPTQTKEDVVEIKEPEIEKLQAEQIDKEEEREEQEDENEPEVESVPEKSEVELRAEQITEAQIKKYWKSIENQWRTPRLHQEGLSVEEKVLRYFDMSSQYGPCVGMPRMKRWQRAERLSLSPPIEVLAVLFSEEEKGNKKTRIVHMDEILNSTAVGQ